MPHLSTTAARSGAERPVGVGPWGRPAAAGAAGLGVLVLSWLLLDGTHTVPGWEADVFAAVNGLPDGLRWALWPIMQLGALWMYVVAGVTVYASTQRWRPALATAVAVVLAWLGGRLIKAAVARGRPPALLDDVDLREGELHSYGYVSGHTSVAFALATVLTALLPGRWRWLPYPVAALVGLARMFFGVHLPLDVLGGAGLGVVCGVVALVAFGVVGPGRAHAADRPVAGPPADPADQPADPSSSG